MYHSPSKQVSSVTLLVHVHNPQPVSWIEHTVGNIWIRSSIDGQFFYQKHYVCLSGAIWGSRQWQEKPEVKPCKELTTSCTCWATAQLGSWAHLWLWPVAEQWRSFQFLSLPPEEQAPLWLHTLTAVPAEQQRDEWQQMSGCPCLYQLKNKQTND